MFAPFRGKWPPFKMKSLEVEDISTARRVANNSPFLPFSCLYIDFIGRLRLQQKIKSQRQQILYSVLWVSVWPSDQIK